MKVDVGVNVCVGGMAVCVGKGLGVSTILGVAVEETT